MMMDFNPVWGKRFLDIRHEFDELRQMGIQKASGIPIRGCDVTLLSASCPEVRIQSSGAKVLFRFG